jgi:IclR family acetate operon transcriptional repressor
MPQWTPYTLISPSAFFEDVKSIKQQGFAISEQEYEEEINAVSAPIFDLEGRPIASVAVAGPAYRLTRERMIEIGPVVVFTARQITQEITVAAIPLVSSAVYKPTIEENNK